VVLNAYSSQDGIVRIDVSDHCGGLPPGLAAQMFRPFTQAHDNKNGLGLGLSIARRGVEGDGGTLGVRDIPGVGCVFTISLPAAPDRRK
jgi:C4-dicarboxylate-specific signal transduction histidine kinase